MFSNKSESASGL